jgi:hypothetical protein
MGDVPEEPASRFGKSREKQGKSGTGISPEA